MKKDIIPIFFTVDNSYAPYLDCAVNSLIQNASNQYEYRIYVLYEGLTDENQRLIARCENEVTTIEFIEMRNQYEGLTDRIENRLRCDYFTLTIYFRLFIADMFPQYNKGIYVDSDIVVPGDISELYQIDLKDNILGACPDHSIRNIPELVSYTKNTVGTEISRYINSGVLLMNLNKMREKQLSKHFLDLLNQYHFNCVAPDQDYLNAMCYDQILFLDECWDAMPPEAGNDACLSEPKLIHYNLFQKPWCYDDIPYEEYFWNYAKESPFYRQILDAKANYSKEQKQSDKECLENLVHKSGIIENEDVTFRKIIEHGVRVRL